LMALLRACRTQGLQVPTGLADGLEVGVLYRVSRPFRPWRNGCAPVEGKDPPVVPPRRFDATLAIPRIMQATGAIEVPPGHVLMNFL
jgi:hypothetical protein